MIASGVIRLMVLQWSFLMRDIVSPIDGIRSPFGPSRLNPALSLDFLSGSLDSRVTFSRASQATMYDSTGKLTFAPNNLVLNSATLSTQSVTVAPINYILSFKGTGTITKSGTATGALAGTGASDRVFEKFTPTAGSLTLTVSGSVTEAQLEAVTYQTTPRAYVATTGSAYYGPRFDHNPATLAARGLLIEESRANLLTYSEQFNNAAWISFSALASADVTAAPSGGTVADKITEVAGSASQSKYNSATASFSTVTASAYFKSSERDFAQLSVSGGGGAQWFAATFDLTTGVVTQQLAGASGTISGATITNAGNGWYRCTVTGITGASSGATFVYVGPSTTGTLTPGAFGVLTYTGTAGSGVFAWGAQLEEGSFATSYIPTVAASVTRAADSVTMTGTNFSSWYNQSEGTFVTEAGGFVGSSGVAFVGHVSDGTTNEYIDVGRYQPTLQALIVDGGVNQASLTLGGAANGTSRKLAVSYKVNDFAACQDGGTVQTDVAGTVPTVDRLWIGSDGNLVRALNSHIASLTYYNTRLSDATLQSLTT